MTAVTKLVFFPELQGLYRNRSVSEMACLAIPLAHRCMDELLLKINKFLFVTVHAGLRRKSFSHGWFGSPRSYKNSNTKDKNKFNKITHRITHRANFIH